MTPTNIAPTEQTAPTEDAGPEATTGVNLVVVRGHLSSDPVQRELPSGDLLHSYELTVRSGDLPADTVPVVLIGAVPPKNLCRGSEVLVVGRVRRRFFRAGGSTASRTEVVAERIVAARRTSAVAGVLHQASERLKSSPS
ncbi:MAG: single-stranded DNA-binding protein [Acidimicrobiia bacterium]|nr:single-stranded DNA-binding protein [Acidimicrobiia bacterium]